jgi:hypothetical protein
MSLSIKNIFLLSVFLICSGNDLLAQESDTTVTNVIDEYVDEDENPQATLIADTPVVRHVPLPLVDSLKRLKVFEYANDPEYWVREKEVERRSGFWDFIARLFNNRAFKWFIYIVFGSLLLWALYKIIISNNLFLFTSRNKKLKEETVEEEIRMPEATLDEKIAQLIAEKNYRFAIRYLFIKALQQLNEKGLISYHARATNYDYIKQMSSHKLGSDFRFLTQVYEYVWYGEFEIRDDQFSIVHNRFNDFLNRSKPWQNS